MASRLSTESRGSWGTDAIQMRIGPDEDRSAGYRDRRQSVTIDPVAGQLAEFVPRRDNRGSSFLAHEIDATIRIDGRRRMVSSEASLPVRLSGPRVKTLRNAVVADH